eukprot:scaffold15432_cov85-Cyclotella_meneghiniana.AAC.1
MMPRQSRWPKGEIGRTHAGITMNVLNFVAGRRCGMDGGFILFIPMLMVQASRQSSRVGRVMSNK